MSVPQKSSSFLQNAEAEHINTLRTTLQTALKSIMSHTVSIFQVAGYFIFVLEADNNLKPRFFLLISICANAIFFLLSFVPYFLFRSRCRHVFGEYSSADTVGNILQLGSVSFGANIFRIWMINKRNQIIEFHKNLTSLTCEMAFNLYEPESPMFNVDKANSFLKLIMSNKKLTNRKLLKLFVFSLINCLTIIVPVFILTISVEGIPSTMYIFAVVTLLLSLHGILFPALSIWLGSYIEWLAMLYRMLTVSGFCVHNKPNHDHVTAEKLLITLENLDKSVETFNSIFAVPIIFWILTMSAALLQQLFSILRWISIGFLMGAVINMTMMLYSPVAVFDFCNTSYTFSQQVNGDLDQLMIRLMANNNMELGASLKSKLSLHNQKRQSNLICICPGHFFTLNRKTLTQLSGLILTYLIVLMQFRDPGESQEPVNLDECYILLGNFSEKVTNNFKPPIPKHN